MTVEAHVLKEGTIDRDTDGTILDASSSVTLVLAADQVIVVDTAMPHDGPELIEALARHGLDIEDVGIVVNTHGHHDHTGCNRLFGQAEVVIHMREGSARPAGGTSRRVEEDFELVPGVRIIETPGHTRGSISVVAETPEGPWVMAGDALPTLDNFVAWVPPGVNYDPEVAMLSMERVVELAWMIVPGHGAPFLRDAELPNSVRRYLR